MPKTKRPAPTAPEALPDADRPSADAVRDLADALYRSARESCRQRHRYSCLVEHGVGEAEQRAALRMLAVCDELLLEATDAYERAASRAVGYAHHEWWHKANALWLVSREYERHQQGSDRDSRRFGDHAPKKFAQLAMRYDLEASALLSLRHALDAYQKVRPESELNGARPANGDGLARGSR